MLKKIKEYFSSKVFSKVKNIFKSKKEKSKQYINDDIESVKKEVFIKNDKVSNFLSNTNYTIKDIININNKIEELSKDESDMEKLETFLHQNSHIDNSKRLIFILNEICYLLRKREESLQKNIEKSQKFINFMISNNMECMDGFVKLYEKMILLDNYEKRIDILNKYIEKHEYAKNENMLIDKMEELLDPEVDLDILDKMNDLEIKKQYIDDDIDYEMVIGAYFYDVDKVEKLIQEYKQVNNEYNELAKIKKIKKC